MFCLMTCVNCLNFINNCSNNFSIIFMSHTHCIHDLFRHILCVCDLFNYWVITVCTPPPSPPFFFWRWWLKISARGWKGRGGWVEIFKKDVKEWKRGRGTALKRGGDWKMEMGLNVLFGILCAEKWVRMENIWAFVCLFQVCPIKILILWITRFIKIKFPHCSAL